MWVNYTLLRLSVSRVHFLRCIMDFRHFTSRSPSCKSSLLFQGPSDSEQLRIQLSMQSLTSAGQWEWLPPCYQTDVKLWEVLLSFSSLMECQCYLHSSFVYLSHSISCFSSGSLPDPSYTVDYFCKNRNEMFYNKPFHIFCWVTLDGINIEISDSQNMS